MKLKIYSPPKERMGLIIFVLLIISCHTYSSLHQRIYGYSEEEKLELLSKIVDDHYASTPNKEAAESIKEVPMILPPFDPNTVKTSKLTQYGISSSAARNLEKYRQAGGSFQSLQDIKKIYGMDSSVVTSLAHLIQFPKRREKKKRAVKINDNKKKKAIQDPARLRQLLPFDPNTAGIDVLINQGLSTYAANNLVKYRSKGGKLYNNTDLLRIYGVDSSMYHKVEPRIRIANIEEKPFVKREVPQSEIIESETVKTEAPAPIDLNHATAEELIQLKGIGPVLSSRIVIYKNKLGGYHKIDQITEIYGLEGPTFDNIRDRLTVSGPVDKIYIPSLTFKEVLNHPYIDYETTKLLKNISILIFDLKLQEFIELGRIDERLLPYLHLSDPDLIASSTSKASK